MARGRKPDLPSNVVRLTQDGKQPGTQTQDAKEMARDLKPRGLPKDVAAVWDAVAPVLAEKHRLDPLFVLPVVELCHCVAKMNEYRALFRSKVKITDANGRQRTEVYGETYEVEGRNGNQMKTRPEVAQFNETRRTFLRLTAEFGMTPSASRSLASAAGQGDLFDDFDDFAQGRGT
ncbi:P27 family phage terminase small subunit [Thalassospira sp. UBA1131]|uniref:P27 family phage terminase small subunit n=1 Tax=Thalassospira sp. UBA1131 TaxID=1947672 RepID=UPI0025FC356B|nr:P27 family phage terminase small subunit [Thalassospira sp. UBA1131]